MSDNKESVSDRVKTISYKEFRDMFPKEVLEEVAKKFERIKRVENIEERLQEAERVVEYDDYVSDIRFLLDEIRRLQGEE